jgi:hypothetical protein
MHWTYDAAAVLGSVVVAVAAAAAVVLNYEILVMGSGELYTQSRTSQLLFSQWLNAEEIVLREEGE